MVPIACGLCSICGERLPDTVVSSFPEDHVLCELCRRHQPPFVKATAYGSYEGGLRELIHLLKYDQIRPAANLLGRMLADAIGDLQPLLSIGACLVVPVPLHARKLRQRGFNQAELIARAAMKLIADPNFRLAPEILERCRETQSQIGLSRHQRRENMRGAFAVVEEQAVAGKQILVVDDVFTTGTTVSECARVLRRAGASKVYVATVARTLKFEVQSAKPLVEAEDTLAMAAATS